MATQRISRNWEVEGTLTDVTSATLEDPTGTYGVKRDDDDSVVVAAGTAMTKVSTGMYEYTFTEPAEGITYTAWVKFVYGGNTYWYEHDLPAGSTAPAATVSSTGRKLTYADALDHLIEFAAGHGVSAANSLLRRAILRAYDEVINGWEWPCLKAAENIYCHAAQTDGTISYDHDTLTVTLSGATFPSWTDGASLYLDGITCDINQKVSDTTATLRSNMAPGADLSGESYTLYRRWYALPSDWLSNEEPLGENYADLGSLIPWSEMLQLHRWEQSTGTIDYWAVGQAPSGGLALFIYPALDDDVRLLLPYKSRPRDLRISGHDPNDYVGTITISGTAVTGSGTAFKNSMEGSILRVSDTTDKPTGLEGLYPYFEELVIDQVDSETSLTTTEAGTTASGVGYRVSDPIDVDRAVWDAILHCAEVQLARMRNIKSYSLIRATYLDAMQRAKATAAGEQPHRRMGGMRKRYRRLADFYTP